MRVSRCASRKPWFPAINRFGHEQVVPVIRDIVADTLFTALRETGTIVFSTEARKK